MAMHPARTRSPARPRGGRVSPGGSGPTRRGIVGLAPWLLVLAMAGCTPEQDAPAPRSAAAAERDALVQAYAQDPERTRRQLASVLATHVGGATAETLSSDELAGIDRIGPDLLRVGLGFRGAIPAQQGGRQAVRGEFRVYLHDQGVVAIESLCADDPDRVERACSDRERLLLEAERRVQAGLHGHGVGGLLPAGDCQDDSASEVAGGSVIATIDCAYPGGVMLTLYRLGGEQGRALQRSLVAALPGDPADR